MDKTDAEAKKAPDTKTKEAKTTKTTADKPVAKETTKKVADAEKKPIYTKWQFWTVIGALVVAVIVILILVLPMVLKPSGPNGTGDSGQQNGDYIAACQGGAKDMISGGQWIVGVDIASGDYKFTPSDKYASVYVYPSESADDYLKYISLSDTYDSSAFVHVDNGQMLKVSSGTVDMACQDLGDIELVSTGKTMGAGAYTLVSAGKYLSGYIYNSEGDSDYDAYVSVSEVGGEKSLRFKDGQYLKISSGNAFLINMNNSDADELVKKAKQLAGGSATTTESTEKKEESKPAEKTESTSSSSSSSSDSSSSSSTSSSTSTNWRQLIKDYESWVDDYATFMKKYKDADSSQLSSMMSDYTKLLSEMTEWSDKMEDMEDDLSGSDLTEYLNALTRVTQKLNSISQ